MMKLYVDKLLNRTILSSEEQKDLVNKIISMRVSNFIKKYKLNLSPSELYMRIYNIKSVPKCEYCDSDCIFLSLSKGFSKHCYKEICKRKHFIKGNNSVKNENRILYDKYLKSHSDFYNNVKIPFIDPYDNSEIKSHKQFCSKSASSLDILNEDKKCIFCKRIYTYNKFKYNKCFCKSCYKGHNYKYLSVYEKYSEIDFDIFKLNLKRKKFTNRKLLNLSKKYDNNKLYKLLTDNAIIYNNRYLERSTSKDPFRYLYNNIITKDMYAKCKYCGKYYIKYDKVIIDNKLIKVKIGAKYSCNNKECYYKCIKLYGYSDEQKRKQSISIKKRIKNGEYTPCVTNSWTHTKIFSLDNIKFRSSWEFLFYLINRNTMSLQYEKIRIPYFDNELNKERLYITDFYDPINKVIYEIKPYVLENDVRNIEKTRSATEYAKNNGITFKIINENYFKKYYNKNVIFNYIPENLKKYCEKLWRQFE